MKKSLFLTFIIFSGMLFSQNAFKIKLTAPDYVNDSLYFGVTETGKNTLDYYNLKFQYTSDVHNFHHFPGVMVKISEKEVLIEGNSDYPQPVGFGYMNRTKGTYNSQNFFLEKGEYHIDLQNLLLDNVVKINSPANAEYENLKKFYSHLYTRSKSGLIDSLKSLNEKEEVIKKYIKKNPKSFVALWDMIYDYGFVGYNAKYLENLDLFDKEVKNSKPYNEFKKTLEIEKSTNVGNIFPELIVNKLDSIGIKNFRENKYTLISYWGFTNCASCLNDFPVLRKLADTYGEKGFKIISVSAEEMDKMLNIAKIMKMKKATWQNHPDYNKTFPTKLAAYGIPVNFLVDSAGKIVLRENGNLQKVEDFLKNNLK